MSTLDRSKTPKGGPIRNFDFPAVDRRVLKNGLDLRVAHMNRLPVVSLNLFVRSGESALYGKNAGLAVLAADALEGGTARRTGSELAEALERIGARVSATGGWEGTSIGLSCLAERLDEAVGLLAEAVLEPSFPEEEVARARDQQLAGIRQRAKDPASLASDTAPTRYFTEGSPYARPIDGSAESIAEMSRDQLRGYASANFLPAGGGLIVAGDVETREVEQMVADHFTSWSGAPASIPDFSSEAATRERRVYVVHRPGSVQTEIRVGHVGAARSTPDYYALSVANMVLGGMFTSRLNLNLREKNGFTYGVRSRFSFRSEAGPFEVSTSVGNDVTASAVREIMVELKAMAAQGPTADEVAAARDYAAGIFGLQLETAGQVAARVTQLVVYGLPERYFDDYRDNVRDVTTEEVAAAAAIHIRPDEVQVVLVGDADVIGPPVEELGLGPVEVVASPS
ncbi:MAG: pitrilysin family protein [Gemmatimonadetes bacterium]|nr:pitrilysin family protein [Gemmatimonadota bacterium]MDA1103150.1 pitrilysin family protein [Gemmatimonadota bacterium]